MVDALLVFNSLTGFCFFVGATLIIVGVVPTTRQLIRFLFVLLVFIHFIDIAINNLLKASMTKLLINKSKLRCRSLLSKMFLSEHKCLLIKNLR